MQVQMADRLQKYLTRLTAYRNARIQRLCEVIFPHLPKLALTWVAASLARNRALNWYPGWKFGDSEYDGSLSKQLRLSLWKFYEVTRIDAPFTIPWYDNLRVTMYLGNDMSLCAYVAGSSYEPNEFMFLSGVLKPGMIFIDVGANDGLYTLFASRRVGSSGKVLALEPSSREFARLEKNLLLNNTSNVLALQIAAADHEGVATLRIAEFGHEGQNTLGGFAYSIEQEGTEEIPLITLDGIISKYNLTQIDVIKMDVEGGELNALKGAQSILTKHKPLILLEIVEAALKYQGASRETVLGFLASFGYSFLVFGPSGRPERVTSVKIDGVNIIAIHRDSTITF